MFIVGTIGALGVKMMSHGFQIANMTLETEVKVIYIYSLSVWLEKQTLFTIFGEGGSYFVQCCIRGVDESKYFRLPI